MCCFFCLAIRCVSLCAPCICMHPDYNNSLNRHKKVNCLLTIKKSIGITAVPVHHDETILQFCDQSCTCSVLIAVQTVADSCLCWKLLRESKGKERNSSDSRSALSCPPPHSPQIGTLAPFFFHKKYNTIRTFLHHCTSLGCQRSPCGFWYQKY